MAFLQAGEDLVNVVHVGLDAGGVAAVDRADTQIFLNGELGKDLSCFGNLNKSCLNKLVGLSGGGLAEKLYRTAGGFHDRGNALEQGGFTGSVCTEDGYDLALLNLKRDASERLDSAVSRGEVINFQNSGHYSSPPRYARITSGFALTSAGVPTAMVLPKLRTVQ